MKILYKIIYVLAFLLFPLTVLAFEGGQVVLSQDIAPLQNESRTYEDAIHEYYEKVKLFDEKFPGNQIEEADLDLALKLAYPKMTDKDVSDQVPYIKAGVKIMRLGQSIYDKYKEMRLTPPEPVIQVEEADYDYGKIPAYVDSGSDKPLIIQDFKKVLNYGSDVRDFKAVEEHVKKQIEKASGGEFDEITGMLSQLDFKKLLYYGILYDNPFTGKKGIGSWVGKSPVKARLISKQTSIDSEGKIEAALHISVDEGYLIVKKSAQSHIPFTITFPETDNLEEPKVLWPLPQRFINYGKDADLFGYTGSFAIPVDLKVKEAHRSLELSTTIKFTLCGKNICQNEELKPLLKLNPGKGISSPVANFISLSRSYIPAASNPDLQIQKVLVDKNDSGQPQELRIILSTKATPQEVDVFVESKDNIAFSRPRISIDGNRIIARLQALDSQTDLNGRVFEITARVNAKTSLRQTHTAQEVSLFDVQSKELTLGIILLGFVGGFLLNLMPCVFPVLSLKLLFFTKFGGRNLDSVRFGFLFHVLGILTAFLFLAGLLITLKAFGHAIGWGMQFQNVGFLSAILFVLVIFMAQVWGIIEIKTPQFVSRIFYSKHYQDNFMHYLTGLFMVLLATPCTAPYLGTALGFALSGTYVDILVVMLAVGLGLALPYVLIAAVPELAFLVPAPGPWMNKLSRLMNLMLFLTILWLLSVLSAQTSWLVVLRFGFYLLGFLFILWFHKLLIEAAERQDAQAKIIARSKHIFNLICLFLSLSLFAAAFFDAHHQYKIKREYIRENQLEEMVDTKIISSALKNGQKVLLRIGADWCLTCKYNEFTVFKNPVVSEMLQNNQIVVIDVDWTNYNQEILEFMGKFGRKGLPFYIIFSPKVPGGMVLPEIVNEQDFRELLKNI